MNSCVITLRIELCSMKVSESMALSLIVLAIILITVLVFGLDILIRHLGAVTSADVTILDKSNATYPVISTPGRPAATNVTYYTVTCCISGESIELNTSAKQYWSIKKGNTGTLKYKKDKLISFK